MIKLPLKTEVSLFNVYFRHFLSYFAMPCFLTGQEPNRFGVKAPKLLYLFHMFMFMYFMCNSKIKVSNWSLVWDESDALTPSCLTLPGELQPMASSASVASLVITLETGLSDEEGSMEQSQLGDKSWEEPNRTKPEPRAKADSDQVQILPDLSGPGAPETWPD